MKQQHVAFCSVCGKVRDEIGSVPGQEEWVEMRAYKMKHGLQSADLHLAQTYCPECVRLYQGAKPTQSRPTSQKR